MRKVQQPTAKEARPRGGSEVVREEHPAWGLAVVRRTTGGGGKALFQSDLQHQHTITLSIHEADRERDLHTDWTHPGKEVVEIEMSLAQWGELVSSIGLGGGVPCTIRTSRDGKLQMLPDVPYQPRMGKNLDELDGSIEEMLEGVNEAMEELGGVIEDKKGIRALRGAFSKLRGRVAGIKTNSRFAVNQLSEAAEQVVNQAKADVEAHIVRTKALTDSAPIGSLEIPSPRQIKGGVSRLDGPDGTTEWTGE